MAHWIITNNYITTVYKCSECGSEYHDCVYSPEEWKNCPNCESTIESESKELAELGKYVADGFAAGLKSGGFVMMSRKDYDKMVDDFNICIEERDREMFKLDKELREVKEERDQYLDILKNMGLSEERSKLIVPGTGKFIEEEISPITMNRKIYCCFEIDGSWKE